LAIISEGSNLDGLLMQPESIDIPGIHASAILENSRLFMCYNLRMLILAYLNVSKIIKSSFFALGHLNSIYHFLVTWNQPASGKQGTGIVGFVGYMLSVNVFS